MSSCPGLDLIRAPGTSLDARGNARFFVTSIFLRTRLSLFVLSTSPAFPVKAGAKVGLNFQLPNFSSTFFKFFPSTLSPIEKLSIPSDITTRSSSRYHHASRVMIAFSLESGCKDKGSLFPFPNIFVTFFQKKIL